MNKKRMVMVVGGGKVGSYLAGLLLKSGCEVRLIESRPSAYEKLVRELPSQIVVLGDGTTPLLLERNGIANADVLAAVTGDDETNLVAASLAKYEYGVERVIMRINNPRNAWLCTPEMGIDVAINQSDMLASMIVEEMHPGDLQTLARLRQGEVEIIEEIIPAHSPLVDKSLVQLGLPQGCNVTAIIRGSEVIVPHGSTVIAAEDVILFVTHRRNREALQKVLVNGTGSLA